MSLAAGIGYGLAAYLAAGFGTGLAFIVVGVDRVLPRPASFTPWARLMLLPGAAVLWPVVLTLWLKTKGQG